VYDCSALLSSCSALGVAPAFLDFLNSYLQPREGRVLVEGAISDSLLLCDMVFQGTVLGPRLWNAFFQDIAPSIGEGSQVVELFADDLNVSTSCATEVSNDVLIGDLRDAQQRTHAWGQEHRVSFDPTKEHIKVLHPQFGDDSTFKLLGTLIDCRLTMDPCIDSVISKIWPKIKALLRTRSTYSVSSKLDQYRAHIWPHVEYSTMEC